MADIFWFIEQGWKTIWKQRTIWIFSVLPVLGQFTVTPQGDRDINLLPSLIAFTFIFISFVSFIGVHYVAYSFLVGKPVTVKETLSAVRKFAGRVIGCSCLVLLIVAPCILVTFAISADRTGQSPQISNSGFIIFQLFSIFGAVTEFAMFGFFANNSGIRQALRDAWALFTDHFRVLAALGLITTIMLGMFNIAAGIVTVLLQSGFDMTSLSQINYINPSVSLSENVLFMVLSGIGQTIFLPFSASVFALAYLKYSRVEIPLLTRKNQPKNPL